MKNFVHALICILVVGIVYHCITTIDAMALARVHGLETSRHVIVAVIDVLAIFGLTYIAYVLDEK